MYPKTGARTFKELRMTTKAERETAYQQRLNEIPADQRVRCETCGEEFLSLRGLGGHLGGQGGVCLHVPRKAIVEGGEPTP